MEKAFPHKVKINRAPEIDTHSAEKKRPSAGAPAFYEGRRIKPVASNSRLIKAEKPVKQLGRFGGWQGARANRITLGRNPEDRATLRYGLIAGFFARGF